MKDVSFSHTLDSSAAPPSATQRRVSADSFRRLTSLLKKAEPSALVIPEIFAPTPQPIIEAFHATPVAQELAAIVQPEALVEPEPIVTAALPPAAIELSPEPELALVLPEIEVAPVVAVALPEPEIELLVPEPVVLAAVAEPTPPPPPEIKVNHTPIRRQAKRDEFAEVLAVPKKAAAPQLTPQQEIEQAEVGRSLIDMMSGAGAGGGQPHERSLAADTLLRMLPRLSQAIRVVLAQRLAMMDAPPPFLVSQLLVDSDLAVSGPLLEDCMHIADENLFPVIAHGNPDRLRLIARRRRLSPAVAEALIGTADTSVLLTLVRNAAAEIPQEGFAELGKVAESNPELLPPICIRHDLPIHIAFELFWAAPVQLRRYLLTRFLTDSENLTRILRITMQGEDGCGASIAVEEIGAALVLALAGQTEEAAQRISKCVGVTPATVERIFADTQGEALMALLKVAGVSRADLSSALPQLCVGEHALTDPSRVYEELQAVFDQLSFTKARILLTYWDWAITQSGPYARQH